MPSPTTVNVISPPDLFRYVQAKVSDGGYAGVSEFVREALREKLLREQREEGSPALGADLAAEHRLLVREGIDAFEQGDYAEFDEAGLKDLMREVSARGSKALASRRKTPAS